MNGTTLIDSCHAHLPVQQLRTSNSFARNDTGVVIDSKPHLSGTCKTSLLFAPLAVPVHAYHILNTKCFVSKMINIFFYV